MLTASRRFALAHTPAVSCFVRQACAASTSAAAEVAGAEEPAANPRPTSLEYARQLAQQNAALSKLRKAWASEFAEVQAKKAEVMAALAKERSGRKATKGAVGPTAAEREAAQAARRQALAAAKTRRMEEKTQRAHRQLLREDVLKFAREERKAALLETSRWWITPETLEARVEHALENPAPLSVAGGGQQ